MRRSLLIMLLAAPAWAGEFVIEAGSGFLTTFTGFPGLTIDGAIEGRIALAHGGSIDLRARFFGKPAFGYDIPGVGHTATVRYRTPRLGSDTVDFTLAAGGGLFIWFGATGGDVLIPWPGGAVELSPTLNVTVSKAVRFFIAVNIGLNVLVNGYGFFTAGLGLGFSFDLTKSHAPPVNETVVIPSP